MVVVAWGQRSGLSPRGRGNRTGLCRHQSCVGGLSPRGRGNQVGTSGGIEIRVTGSIPAWAGEPYCSLTCVAAVQSGLSPRGRGNPIVDRVSPKGQEFGLSPRGRGNLVEVVDAIHWEGSIPAWAGEPCRRGGSFVTGLSPRGRGNHIVQVALPRAGHGVYPRVGGGLSPRGRGNLVEVVGLGRVYPRVGGGTFRRVCRPQRPVYPRVGGGTPILGITSGAHYCVR